jgi:predicted ATPase/Tfp pilus assembly protein PilF
VQPQFPTGTVTFLFTDIEGSTRLLQELGEGYADVLAEHHRVLRVVWTRHRGVEVDTAGDAFFVAFARASEAVAAAADAQRALAAGPVRVRMGLHTGEPLTEVENYVGIDVHRAARIAAAGHGGQVLLSEVTAGLAGADVRDLGLHRLKDLSGPERLFQLGTEDFPPLKTLHETNLPVPATPFLGREREIEEIAVLLGRSEVRIVTLTGPGGSGKTRLSLQAAAAAADGYPHGVWWVPLASVGDPALVETAAAQALGSKDTLAATIGDKRLMLVLDNFEHLLDAVAGLAETVGACPRLTVLVTSREPLHVDGEWEVAVNPLLEREAMELFVQRASAVRSDFTANGEVAEICRRLDNLPLAIELAAARVKALSLPVLLERLEQRLPLLVGGSRAAPERQRTLRSTIAWSHDLLTEAEQELFARLAVFTGGCTLDAAEEICGADVDAITSLVDKSLLRRTDDRYWMLETIREFAAEQLDQLPDARSLRDAHAAWYVMLAERARPELRAREARTWLERLDAEQANVRAALDHLVACGDADGALRLSGAIWPYWQTRGHWTEGRRYLAAALSLGDDAQPARHVDALWGAAFLALWQGDVHEGEELADRLLDLSQQAELEHGRSVAIHVLAIAALQRGDRDRARTLNEEALVLARQLNDDWLVSVITNNLGDLLMGEGEFERAAELFEESLAIGEARGDLDRRARALVNLGYAAHRLGDGERAHELCRRALTAAEEIGLVEVQLWALLGIAAYEAEGGDAIAAARLLGRVKQLESDLRSAEDDEGEEFKRRTLAALQLALPPDRLAAELAAGAALPPENAIDLALGRNGLQTPQAAAPTSD